MPSIPTSPRTVEMQSSWVAEDFWGLAKVDTQQNIATQQNNQQTLDIQKTNKAKKDWCIGPTALA
jgi:hypothetical protein